MKETLGKSSESEADLMNAVLNVIEDHYGDQRAERTGVKYMNHIYEGLNVMTFFGMGLADKIAYALHPIYQEYKGNMYDCTEQIYRKNPELNEFRDELPLIEGIVYAESYPLYANSYLSKHHTLTADLILPKTIPPGVKNALIADKIQNRKDFEIYHKATHPNSKLLTDYFRCWFKALDISENVYKEALPHCKKINICFFTGAGMSVESGIKAFRATDGTWEDHDVDEVATPDGWRKDRSKVLNFYNARIKQLETVKPNYGHHLIAKYQHRYDISVVTQNVDNLHERAGSEDVLHLHGELMKKCSSLDPRKHITSIKEGETIELGSKAPDGSQWRPFVVWFTESVPNLGPAKTKINKADILVIIGTSLNVYPAAGLINNFSKDMWQINPEINTTISRDIKSISKGASDGLEEFFKKTSY